MIPVAEATRRAREAGRDGLPTPTGRFFNVLRRTGPNQMTSIGAVAITDGMVDEAALAPLIVPDKEPRTVHYVQAPQRDGRWTTVLATTDKRRADSVLKTLAKGRIETITETVPVGKAKKRRGR